MQRTLIISPNWIGDAVMAQPLLQLLRARHPDRPIDVLALNAGRGIGVVVPGMVDRRSGRIVYAPRLGWRDVDIRDALASRTGIPVHVESAPIACACVPEVGG